MKTYLIVPFLIVAAASSALAETYTAPITPKRSKPRERPAPPVSQTEVTGVIPRAIRGGNPFQMLNPLAPRKYGTSQEAVTYDQNDPAKWRGIKFFEIRF
ncbi:MAG TPA: hypothetical protein VGI42_08005 [Chthoniobacterales bacterium]|jgi:hypothetical protein